MKKIASAARTTLLGPVSKKLRRARFADGLKVPACYPESGRSIHLH